MTSTDGKLLDWEDLDFPTRVFIKSKSEKSFLNFTRFWFELMIGEKMLVNWHIRLITKKMDAIYRGHESVENYGNIIINIPPGGMKTMLLSVMSPAYLNVLSQIGVIDKFRNMNISYANTLVERNSRQTRDMISSREYQELWPCTFGVNKAEEWEILDDRGKIKAQTTSRAIGGQITGGRGGYFGPSYSGAVIQDDPDKPEDMFSQTKRESAHRRQTNTVRSRRGDKSKDHPTPMMLIQQRLHDEDTSAFLLGKIAGSEKGIGIKFDHIEIPALITEDYLAKLPKDVREDCWNCIKDSDCREINGVKYWSYWPEMEHVDQLIEVWEADEYTFMSQYMQNPIKQSGSLIDCDWFGRYTTLPFLEWAAIYVDTNSGKVNDRNDFTVFTLCAMGDDGNMYVLAMERGKWDPEELQAKANELWESWRKYPELQRLTCRYMSIEDKQAGQGLITTLNKKKRVTVKAVPRGADSNKVIRFHNVQPQIKRGMVMIPNLHEEGTGDDIKFTRWWNGDKAYSTEWVMPFLNECAALTYDVLLDRETGYDDQFDTLMDGIDDMLLNPQMNSVTKRLITRKKRRR